MKKLHARAFQALLINLELYNDFDIRPQFVSSSILKIICKARINAKLNVNVTCSTVQSGMNDYIETFSSNCSGAQLSLKFLE